MFNRINKLAAGLGMLMLAGQASAVIIDDNYIGSNSHGYGDVISAPGDHSYDISNMDVTFGGGYMTVRVNTNFRETSATGDRYGVKYGDLFISSNGWNMGSMTAPYANDNYLTGEHWEYVFDTSMMSLYGGTFTIRNSDSFFGSGYIIRNGQEVQRGTGGAAIGGSSVDLSHAGMGGYIEYNILLSSLGIADGAEIGLKWGMTCANDTIEGAVRTPTSVPEPTALMLLGLGLLGLGATARKRTN